MQHYSVKGFTDFIFISAMLDEPGRDRSANQESCDISAINMLPSEQIQPAIPCEAFFQFPPAGKIDSPREDSVASSVFQRQSESRFVPVSPRSPVCNPRSTCRATEGKHQTNSTGRLTDVVVIPRFERRKTESEKRKYDCSDDCSDSSDEEICQLLCQSSPEYCTIQLASCPMSTPTINNNNNMGSSSSRGSSRGSSRCCCPAEPDQVNLKQPQYPQSVRAFHAVVPQKRFRPSSITVIQRPYLNFDKMQVRACEFVSDDAATRCMFDRMRFTPGDWQRARTIYIYLFFIWGG